VGITITRALTRIVATMGISRIGLIGMTALAVLAAAPAVADVKTGVDAWARGDYSTAIREWQGPAARGDADAQFNLAQAYKLGRGVRADLRRAEELYSLAAAQGHLQASDNYGLLLFQRGERARAVPYITAAAERGDGRSQYLLGLAMFNGDIVAKDWVRGYALVSLARQNGIDQAGPALAQMDKYIPLDQRQQGVALAAQLATAADANRARQLAAIELGARPLSKGPAGKPVPSELALAPPTTRVLANPRAGYDTPDIVAAENAILAAARVAGTDTPATAGADYARPKAVAPRPQVVTLPQPPLPALAVATPAPRPQPTKAAAPKPAPATRVEPAPAPAASAPARQGEWRVQLGAFSVPGNAEALWNKVRGHPELSGHPRISIRAGAVTRLQAGGFASREAANSACSRLSAAGYACLVTRS
jgi:uncharacterized protein